MIHQPPPDADLIEPTFNHGQEWPDDIEEAFVVLGMENAAPTYRVQFYVEGLLATIRAFEAERDEMLVREVLQGLAA